MSNDSDMSVTCAHVSAVLIRYSLGEFFGMNALVQAMFFMSIKRLPTHEYVVM